MTCVVVSRNGEGDAWVFDTVEAARLHPIPQMDDVYAVSSEQLLDQYGRSARSLFRLFPESLEANRVSEALEQWLADRHPRSQDLALETRDAVWDMVRRAASKPPTDPAEIVRIVASDRAAREGVVLRSFSRPGDSVAGSSTRGRDLNRESDDEMTDAAKRDVFRMADDGVIQFGKDSEGKAFGPDNVPKRGDATKELWGKYKAGMKVSDALAAGLSRSNIRRDRRAGYITITNPPEAPKTEKAPKADAKGDKAKA